MSDARSSAAIPDPRDVLDDASRRRLSCQVRPRRGEWSQASFVRLEKAGVILHAPGLELLGGEDLRIWFSLDDVPYTFEASVLRAGVPVPERNGRGVLLGFIEDWKQEAPLAPLDEAVQVTEEAVADPGRDIVILPPSGRGLSVVHGPGRVVDLSVQELTFAVPIDIALKFLEEGRVRVVFTVEAQPHVVQGTVRKLAPGEGFYLYGVHFDSVPDKADHLDVVDAFRH